MNKRDFLQTHKGSIQAIFEEIKTDIDKIIERDGYYDHEVHYNQKAGVVLAAMKLAEKHYTDLGWSINFSLKHGMNDQIIVSLLLS